MSNLFEILSNRKVYIFGAGQRGMWMNSLLKEYGIHVKAFIDNSKAKQGTLISNTRCIDLHDAIEEAYNYCIIVSPKESEDIFVQLQNLGINMAYVYAYETICKERYFSPFIKEQEDYKNVVPFNHYESPYPDIREIHEKEFEIFDYQRKVLDVDFNVQRQLELAKWMDGIDLLEWEMQETLEYRYYYNNSWFGKGSADVLYYMMRILKPGRIIEVGSGFSTAVMLDTNKFCFQNNIEIYSIEPNAGRLKSLIRDDDKLNIQECYLQDVPLDFFAQLHKNDILFIDSSHVSKINSDVNYCLFEILPRLANGVYIHFHDIFYPFIYPKNWIYEGRAYNEMYLLRAFLMNNNKFSIQFFGEMLMREHPDKLSDKLRTINGSLWIRKDN